MRGENDNAASGGTGPFRASALSLLVPATVFAAFYGLVAAGLFLTGKGEGALARLAIVALSAGLPFLIAYAVLRRATARVDVMPHALLLQPGFPSVRQHAVPYRSIRSVSVRTGIGGRLSGSATLVVELAGGSRRAVADLADAEAARGAVLARIALDQEARERHEWPENPAPSQRLAV
jgi:membrane protein YdbS with pleckstrin-like domain